MGGVKKREEFGDPKTIAQLVSTLAMLEDEKHKKGSEDQLEMHVLNSNYEGKNTNNLFLDYCKEFLVDGNRVELETDVDFRRGNKRSRVMVAAGAAASVDHTSSDDSVTGATTTTATTTTTAAATATATAQVPATTRRLWVKDRSRAWWDEVNSPDYPEAEFRGAFRMGRSTFDMICSELSSAVEKEDTMLRAAIPVRQRVAVCIWRLATGEPLRLVSKRFGLGISTCHKLVLEVCAAIRDVLMPKFLQWPSSSDHLRRLTSQFETVSGIPNVVGSMYTTHIPIIAPKSSVSAYFNKRHTERNHKTSYSITLQGVADPSGVFTGGMLKGLWVVGSRAYPLMDWVLVPYAQQHLTWTMHAFNERIGEVESVARRAFGRLKGRWACLQKRTEVKLQDLPVLLGACCVLHNICEQAGEELEASPTFDLFDDEVPPENCIRSVSAAQARDSIAHNLLHHAHAGTTFLS